MTPYYTDESVTLYHGDCREVLAALDSSDPTMAGQNAVDLILTDPPYNVSERNPRHDTTPGRLRRKDGTSRKVWREFGDWDYDFDAAAFLGHSVALLRDGGSLVSFVSEFTLPMFLESGLNHRCMIYWRKTNPAPAFRQLYVRAVEMLVWQVKGVSGWTFNAGGYRPNVFEGPVLAGHLTVNNDEPRVHPAQKPEWLMRALVEMHSRRGDVVVDPFMGSGSAIRAAKDLSRRAIGIDAEERYCEIAARRLSQEVLAL